MKRVPVVLCFLSLAGGVLWLFPLFHVVSIEKLESAKEETRFDAAEFAESFWNNGLLPSLSEAADAATVLNALRSNPQAAGERFGRRVGVSRRRIVMLRGSGRIVSRDKKGVGIALEMGVSDPDVILQAGLLFGNAVRDATGLIDASSFPNSQDYNDISTELNRIVEAQVIPALKEPAAALDRHIQFVGCVELQEDARVDRPLAVIPLEVRIGTNAESPLLIDGPHVR